MHVCVNWVINNTFCAVSLPLSVHVCYHIIVRNSLCTSVIPITASSGGGIVMACGSPECFFAECHDYMVTIPTAYFGGPLPIDQLS